MNDFIKSKSRLIQTKEDMRNLTMLKLVTWRELMSSFNDVYFKIM